MRGLVTLLNLHHFSSLSPLVDVTLLCIDTTGCGEDYHEINSNSGSKSNERDRTRKMSFGIPVASEIMAVLALSTSLKDMRERLGNMVIGLSRAGIPVTADDLGCGGALTVLMIDAIKPTLMQTIEATPVLVHAGPFANIAHGNSSIIADQIALKLVGSDGFVITEAGFGADIGMEKFFNIKCRQSGCTPEVAVIVATIRALKMHGGGPPVKSGSLDPVYKTENLDLVRQGCANLIHHIRNALQYGVIPVVAVNKFQTDTDAEIDIVIQEALKAGARAAVPADHWGKGGLGAKALGEAVIEAAEYARSSQNKFNYLYPLNISIKDKIEAISKKMYGAATVSYSQLAEDKITAYTQAGYDNLPICIAKTQYSLSCDANLKGLPTGFEVHIRDVRASVGAGFIYCLAGDIMTIPGLPTRPGFYDVDIDFDTGKIVGLF